MDAIIWVSGIYVSLLCCFNATSSSILTPHIAWREEDSGRLNLNSLLNKHHPKRQRTASRCTIQHTANQRNHITAVRQGLWVWVGGVGGCCLSLTWGDDWGRLLCQRGSARLLEISLPLAFWLDFSNPHWCHRLSLLSCKCPNSY